MPRMRQAAWSGAQGAASASTVPTATTRVLAPARSAAWAEAGQVVTAVDRLIIGPPRAQHGVAQRAYHVGRHELDGDGSLVACVLGA